MFKTLLMSEKNQLVLSQTALGNVQITLRTYYANHVKTLIRKHE